MILDPHCGTFGGGGGALGRASRATGEAEPVVEVRDVADRATGRRAEGAEASTFEVVEPGNRGSGTGPEGVGEPGNRGSGTRRCGRSNRATGEAAERFWRTSPERGS
jgi:hypothetical protein